MIKHTGFVLSYIRYGDHDAVLHCFTKEGGFQSFFVRGIYSPKSKKKAYLAPLRELSFVQAKAHNTGLPSVSGIEAVETNYSEPDIRRNAIIFFAADFLNQILKNESANPGIYLEIIDFLKQIDADKMQAHPIFLIRILEKQGVLPLDGSAAFLDPEIGSFTETQAHKIFNEQISAKWREIILAEDTYSVKIPKEIRTDFLESILIYYAYHHPGFRIPVSLPIVQQLFD